MKTEKFIGQFDIRDIEDIFDEILESTKKHVGGVSTKKNKTVLEVYVYGEEGKHLPHMHVLSPEKRKKTSFDGCVKIYKAEYFPHSNHISTFNSEQLELFISFMNSLSKKTYNGKRLTYWELATAYWNEIYNNKFEPSNEPMPDYSKMK